MWEYWQHESGDIYAVRVSREVGERIQIVEVDGPLHAGDITRTNIEFGYFSGMPSNAAWVRQHLAEFDPFEV